MHCKKIYITMAVFLAISGSILTWLLLYGDFPHTTPVKAKQVFTSSKIADSPFLRSKFF